MIDLVVAQDLGFQLGHSPLQTMMLTLPSVLYHGPGSLDLKGLHLIRQRLIGA